MTGYPPPKPRSLKWWAIGAALVVIAGIVAAAVTGGGASDTSNTSSSASKLPPGGQMTVVNNAPPPKQGDKVLAAGKTQVHGVYYEVVVSIPITKGPKRGAVPLYFNEYLGKKPKLLQRYLVPNVKFYRDSMIASFKIEANPDPNPGKTAAIAFSWHDHIGDQTAATHYYGVTTHGIQLY